MLEIKDSVAVITGGGGGIGFSIAKYWVQNGGKVVIADVAEELLKQAEADLKALVSGYPGVESVTTKVGEKFNKADLVFLSGEELPRCWTDPHYRDSELTR